MPDTTEISVVKKFVVSPKTDFNFLTLIYRWLNQKMIDEKDKHSIIEIAVKYGIKKVYLFGSALYADYAKVNDIDIGIIGIKSGSYFNFVIDVSDRVSKNIDVIDMEFNPKFAYFIEKEGAVIYG